MLLLHSLAAQTIWWTIRPDHMYFSCAHTCNLNIHVMMCVCSFLLCSNQDALLYLSSYISIFLRFPLFLFISLFSHCTSFLIFIYFLLLLQQRCSPQYLVIRRGLFHLTLQVVVYVCMLCSVDPKGFHIKSEGSQDHKREKRNISESQNFFLVFFFLLTFFWF